MNRNFILWMHAWIDGRTDGRTDGWMDGWMDNYSFILWMDGWMDNYSFILYVSGNCIDEATVSMSFSMSFVGNNNYWYVFTPDTPRQQTLLTITNAVEINRRE